MQAMQCKNVHKLKVHNFKCTECSEKFNEKKHYDAHMKSHIQEKPQKKEMKCIVCEFRAASESDLTMHYESDHINGNNKQSRKANGFQCKDSFPEKKDLDAHIKSYHKVKEKEYKCIVCKTKSRSEADLTKH